MYTREVNNIEGIKVKTSYRVPPLDDCLNKLHKKYYKNW